eukprot:2863359-Pyramimonas_sp.AAC.1
MAQIVPSRTNTGALVHKETRIACDAEAAPQKTGERCRNTTCAHTHGELYYAPWERVDIHRRSDKH